MCCRLSEQLRAATGKVSIQLFTQRGVGSAGSALKKLDQNFCAAVFRNNFEPRPVKPQFSYSHNAKSGPAARRRGVGSAGSALKKLDQNFCAVVFRNNFEPRPVKFQFSNSDNAKSGPAARRHTALKLILIRHQSQTRNCRFSYPFCS